LIALASVVRGGRTLGQNASWSLEAACFVAAAATGCAMRVFRRWLGLTGDAAVIVTAMEYLLRVFFTLAAIGAGLAIPAQLLRNPDF